MELFTQDNGKKEKDLGKENKHGKMDHFMRVFGQMIWLMEKED